jgi:hypothetical protein
MKWFEKLMGSFDEKEKEIHIKYDEDEKEFFESSEPEPEDVNPEPEPELEVEPEPPREILDITVVGDITYEVIEKKSSDNFWFTQYGISFKYDTVVTVLGEEIKCTGEFLTDYLDKIPHEERYGGHHSYYSRFATSVEKTYEYLVELLEEGSDFIMDKLKYHVSNEVKNHLHEKRIAELKNQAGNGKIEINMTFKLEKPEV